MFSKKKKANASVTQIRDLTDNPTGREESSLELFIRITAKK